MKKNQACRYAHNPHYCMIRPEADEEDGAPEENAENTASAEHSVVSAGQS